ncbi:hypothetical protein DVH24_041113 [Malus domestica]|uniref:F-box domain-containing protein n=1 Tax=Malus domestica TaxID=3750 RepID=A0A498I952_MALDO|nr:hypothetical protein DVH24_041113 [Malus domestica]
MSIDYLAEEIIAEILLRLPVKSLIKCRRACKSCPFIDTHLVRFLLIESAHYNRNDGRQLFLLQESEKGEYIYTHHTSYYVEYCTELLKPPILDEVIALGI